MIQKEGRKRSADPIQESLRQEKDNWNIEVSELISQLISFKRGINGRGDLEVGLPPSTIKEPFPEQIPQYLMGLSNRSSKIFEIARKIINDQETYAIHRQSLKRNASWFGSRAISKLKLLWRTSEAERDLRKRLLDSAAEFNRDFKRLEGFTLDYNNPIGIPNAISELTTIMMAFASDFIPAYLKLKNLLEAVEPIKKEIEEEKKIPENKEEKESLPPNQELIQENNFNIKKIEKDSVLLGAIGLDLKDKIPEKNYEHLNQIYDEFSKLLGLYLSLSGKDDAEKIKFDFEKNKFLLQSKYEELKNIINPLIGNISYEEYVSKISNEVKKQALNNIFFIKKEATNALSRYLHKQVLTHMHTPIAMIKLDIVNLSLECRKKLDKIMNFLEKKESSLSDMNKSVAMFLHALFNLADKMESSADVYNSQIRRMERGKNFFIKNITEADFRKLKKAKIRLSPYIFELWD